MLLRPRQAANNCLTKNYKTMESKILIGKAYGKAQDVLAFHVQDLQPLASGMARIKVMAAGINPIDARRMSGEFKFSGLPQTFGTEFAGIITEIDKNNPDWKVGDEVLGSGSSFTHATVIDVPITNLVKKPKSLSWEVAGSIAGVGQTAATIINELGNIKSLLIHGGSGGLGTITIQIARDKGIEALATASEKNQEYLKNLGATAVTYGPGLIERIKAIHPAPFDASVDMIGSEEATQTSLALVKPGGFMGATSGKPLSSAKIKAMWVKKHVNILTPVVDGVASGKYHWEIDTVYPFDQAVDAYTKVLNGHSRGKNVFLF